MTSNRSRKRRRSVAFESPEPINRDVKSAADSDGVEDRAEKGAEVWDAFREEYYEGMTHLAAEGFM